MRHNLFIGTVQVLLLLGVVASLGWPGVWIKRMETKERVTRQAMNDFDRALAAYSDAHERAYPATGEIGDVIRANALPPRDGWGFPLQYRSWPASDDARGGYVLISTGSDGKLDANGNALLAIVEAPAASRNVTELLARGAGAPASRTWAEAFDDDIISISGRRSFDHPPRRMTLKDAPPAVLRQGAIAAGVFATLFLLVTIRHYRRSHAS